MPVLALSTTLLFSTLCGQVQAMETHTTHVPGWVVDRWTHNDGLPANHAEALHFDVHGLAWLASFNGLARFDGLTFERLRAGETAGLVEHRFLGVVGHDELWAWTERGGLYRLRGLEPIQVDTGACGHVHQVVEAHGRLWLGCEHGLAVLEGAAPRMLDLSIGEVDMLWERTGGGLWLATSQPARLIEAPGDPPRPGRSLEIQSGHPWSLVQAADGSTWFGAEGWLLEIGPDGVMEHPSNIEAATLRLDPAGRPWLAGGVRSMWQWGGALEVHRGPPPTDRAIAPWAVVGPHLYRDGALFLEAQVRLDVLAMEASGALWLEERGAGVMRTRSVPVWSIAADTVDAVDCVAATHDDARVLCLDGGAARLDGDRITELRSPDGRPLGRVTALHTLSDARTLLAHGAEICVLAGDRCLPERLEAIRCDVYAMAESADGTLWFGGCGGLQRLSPGAHDVEPSLVEPGVRIRSLLPLSDGSLLAGTSEHGLLRWTPEGIEARTTTQGLASNAIRGLSVDSRGAVWVGTEGGGICRVEMARGEALSEASLACLGAAEGLPETFVSSVQDDLLGRLWLSTNEGLYWGWREQLEAVIEGRETFVVLLRMDESDGLVDAETNGRFQPRVNRDRQGRLWYPTQDGLVVADPTLAALPAEPMILLDELVVDGRRQEMAVGREPMDVVVTEGSLAVRWTAAAFEHADQLHFRYRLRGVDESWRGPTKQRQAAWNEIPPGEYELELEAGWAGRWGPNHRLLQVQRRAALWEHLWFSWVVGLFAVLATIVASIAAQRRSRWRQRQLEAAIALRTEELAQRGLELAERNQRLEDLGALRTRFVANISHELRTPLSLVAAPLQNLEQLELADEPRSSVSLAVRNCRRLEGLLDQLMDVARMEQAGIPLRARRSDLAAFVRRTAERFEALAASRRIRLSVSTPIHSVPAWFDADLLDKVITNLIGNALKFTPEGGRVALDLALTSDDHELAYVSVSDTGTGVPTELRERVFERFYQVDASDSRRHGGTGIGLSLARELVELHGGAMGVSDAHRPLDSHGEPEAQYGGACFWFSLPLDAGHLEPHEVDLEDGAVVSGVDVEGVLQGSWPTEFQDEPNVRARVLVVEDHPDMRAYLCEQLGTMFQVVGVANGIEALAFLAKQRPGVVVSDIMMPEVDGLELCRRIRDDESIRHLPVLLLSAKSAPNDREQGLELADDYLTKPFRVRELIARVRRLAGQPSADRVAAESTSGGPTATTSEAEVPAVPHQPSMLDLEFRAHLERVVAAYLADRSFKTADMARLCSVSKRHLQRRLMELLETTPTAYLREARLVEAKRLLREGHHGSIKEVAALVGMAPAYFSRVYANWAGHPPSDEPTDA